MFRDTSEELARLEAELLAEEEPLTPEEPEEELLEDFYEDYPEEAYEDDYEDDPEDPSHYNYRAYNTDQTDEDLDSYAEAVRTPSRPGCAVGLVALLCLLTVGIIALVALFLRREGLL